jgi:hypothetical protein
VPCQPEPVQVRVYKKCSFPRWVAARDSKSESESVLVIVATAPGAVMDDKG